MNQDDADRESQAMELIRQRLIASAISQLIRVDIDRVVCPVCPNCQFGPEGPVLPDGMAFCSNEDCRVLTWSVLRPGPEQLRTGRLMIEETDPETGRITWRPGPEVDETGTDGEQPTDL